MTVSDNTIAAGGLGDFFNSDDEKGLKASTELAKNVLKNSGRALKNEAKSGTALTSQIPMAA